MLAVPANHPLLYISAANATFSRAKNDGRSVRILQTRSIPFPLHFAFPPFFETNLKLGKSRPKKPPSFLLGHDSRRFANALAPFHSHKSITQHGRRGRARGRGRVRVCRVLCVRFFVLAHGTDARKKKNVVVHSSEQS
jgi:hypothetical protein